MRMAHRLGNQMMYHTKPNLSVCTMFFHSRHSYSRQKVWDSRYIFHRYLEMLRMVLDQLLHKLMGTDRIPRQARTTCCISWPYFFIFCDPITFFSFINTKRRKCIDTLLQRPVRTTTQRGCFGRSRKKNKNHSHDCKERNLHLACFVSVVVFYCWVSIFLLFRFVLLFFLWDIIINSGEDFIKYVAFSFYLNLSPSKISAIKKIEAFSRLLL